MITHKEDFDNKYVCNKAVKPTKNKMFWYWKRVTCLNCLNKQPIIQKHTFTKIYKTRYFAELFVNKLHKSQLISYEEKDNKFIVKYTKR